jgi:hypothetical protein
MSDSLKLAVDIFPAPIRGISLARLNPARWDALGTEALDRDGAACGTCGAAGELQLRETWRYEERADADVAHLTGLKMACADCVAVQDAGQDLDDSGDRPALARHFAAVNGAAEADFEPHLAAAIAEDKRRSARLWTVDFGPWAELVPDPAKSFRFK